jgi:hypothetical protein
MDKDQTHEGGCHCQKVRYKVKLNLENPVLECNCSICAKKGHLLTFVPPEQMEIVRGEDNVTKYEFNKHVIQHTFCSTCGISSYSSGTGPDGKKMFAINARCLDDVDVKNLKINQFDGKSL